MSQPFLRAGLATLIRTTGCCHGCNACQTRVQMVPSCTCLQGKPESEYLAFFIVFVRDTVCLKRRKFLKNKEVQILEKQKE